MSIRCFYYSKIYILQYGIKKLKIIKSIELLYVMLYTINMF